MNRRLLLSGLIASLTAAAASPKLTFIRDFPGSSPAYIYVEVLPDGKGVYKEAPDDDYPIKFTLDPADQAAMLVLAEKIDRCKRPLESGLKVANMGMKTLRWEEETVKNETKFNYTQDLDGQALHDLFEKVAESAQLYLRLERTVKYDKLGVNDSLLKLHAADDRKRIVGVGMYLPLLDRIIKNDSYMHMARERASTLADLFRARIGAGSPGTGNNADAAKPSPPPDPNRPAQAGNK